MRAWVLCVFAACSPVPWSDPPGTTTGSIDLCGDEARSTVGFDEIALGDQSGAGAMELLAGPHVVAGSWFDEREAAVTVTMETADTEVVVIDYPDGEASCARRLLFDAEVSVVSDDGALDLQAPVQVFWSAPFDRHDLGFGLPVGGPNGSLDWAAVAPDATQLIGFIRLAAEDSVDRPTGYITLSTPTPGEPNGEEDSRTEIVAWGD